MKIPDTGKITTIAMIIGVLIVLFVIYKIMSGLGIIKSPAKKKAEREKAEAVNELRTNAIFDPQYYKGKVYKSLGSNQTALLSQHLRQAMQGLGTDEEKIYATFGKLYNKVNVSELALGYAAQFKRDLQTDLLSELSSKEIAILWSLIKDLPNF